MALQAGRDCLSAPHGIGLSTPDRVLVSAGKDVSVDGITGKMDLCVYAAYALQYGAQYDDHPALQDCSHSFIPAMRP